MEKSFFETIFFGKNQIFQQQKNENRKCRGKKSKFPQKNENRKFREKKIKMFEKSKHLRKIEIFGKNQNFRKKIRILKI